MVDRSPPPPAYFPKTKLLSSLSSSLVCPLGCIVPWRCSRTVTRGRSKPVAPTWSGTTRTSERTVTALPRIPLDHRPRSRVNAGPLSIQDTLPRYGISITRLTTPGTGNQSGPHSGSCVSHALHFLGLVAKRKLLRRSSDSMSGRQAGIVSAPRCDFREQNVEAFPYP